MKPAKETLLTIFIISLLCKGLIFANIYMSLWVNTDTIAVVSIFLCLCVDLSILQLILAGRYNKKLLLIFFIPTLLVIFAHTRFVSSYAAETELFSPKSTSIGVGFLWIFLYQQRLVAQTSDFTRLSQSILAFSTYFSLAVSAIIFVSSFKILPVYLVELIPSQSILLQLIYSALAAQAVAIGHNMYSIFKNYAEFQSQIVPSLGVWNVSGFINNSESIRHICARLDQGVTLALFRIDRYSEFKQKMTSSDFEAFLKIFTDWLRFSLRKHDQLALIDHNIYAVLLPFTDLEKGEIAILRLSKHIKQEIILQNLLLPDEFSMSFGLTVVSRDEKNVIPAMKRAAVALSRADAASVVKYTDGCTSAYRTHESSS